MDEEVLHGHPTKLAALFGAEDRRSWTIQELAAILRHQLEAPLTYDLDGVTHDGVVQPLSELVSIAQGLCTFRDLFVHPSPPLLLLLLTKEFAKISDQRTEAPLPTEISTVLYFTSVVCAQRRHQTHISSLTPSQMENGIKWVLAQPWITPELRDLFITAAPDDANCLQGEMHGDNS